MYTYDPNAHLVNLAYSKSQNGKNGCFIVVINNSVILLSHKKIVNREKLSLIIRLVFMYNTICVFSGRKLVHKYICLFLTPKLFLFLHKILKKKRVKLTISCSSMLSLHSRRRRTPPYSTLRET